MQLPKQFVIGDRILTWNEDEQGYDYYHHNRKMGIFPAQQVIAMIKNAKRDGPIKSFLGHMFDAGLKEVLGEENLQLQSDTRERQVHIDWMG